MGIGRGSDGAPGHFRGSGIDQWSTSGQALDEEVHFADGVSQSFN